MTTFIMSSFVNSNISTSKNKPNLREIYICYVKCKSKVIWTSKSICNVCKNNDIIIINQKLPTNNENTIKKQRQIVKLIINQG